MNAVQDALRRLFITGCVLTRSTESAAQRLGAGYFLPALFVLRYASMGGLDPRRFTEQMNGIRSFKDEAWCGYWNAIAEEQLAAAEAAVPGLAAMRAADTASAFPDWSSLRAALAPLGTRVVGLMNPGPASASATEPLEAPLAEAIGVLRSLVKAITYYQVSAFPGGSPARMAAYHRSRALFHEVTKIVAPLVGLSIQPHRIVVDGVAVDGYLVIPPGVEPCPLAIVTNGLEGTVQELAIPLLKYHATGLAVFFMEMPGTYAYPSRMSAASEHIYHGVIDSLSQHPRVDADRIGFVGVSFGAYWAARMAATSPKLRCAVACGAPTHHSFQIGNTIGIPDIIVQALRYTTGATSLHDLMQKLRALSLRKLYAQIKIPLLVINGDKDTLLSTRDSVELAEQAQQGTLKLYPNDDHCAMAHYTEWLDLSQEWMQQRLAEPSREA